MDASLVSAASGAGAKEIAPLLVLRKAMDIQEQSVLTLLDSVPQVSASNNPPNLGQNIDVKA
ncbi:YjfB family protein [Chitinibacter bivalviorum]|uniref:YjfB family protein n=1 Tax=Chitinibacter bivalviorum TaxID=2739434 RepID=A0A7H9BI26_9NEIS|nr:YjfB family protein [Chitinibacter bivalviorum]QLG87858.1 YjfB family protein [Chitinibacter bivalviorum]